MKSEQEFLELIDEFFPREHPSLLLGRGDDCAVLQVSDPLCLSTDLFLEDVHFRRHYFSPADIGYKSLAVNISDILGMGGRPLGFSLGLMVPPGIGTDFFAPLFQSMASLCRDMDMVLTGGDLSRWEKLGLCITVWGLQPDHTFFLNRSGARPGEIVFVLGQVGLARIGLKLLENDFQDASRVFPRAVQSLLRPQLFRDEAVQLAGSGLVTSMMDVSDGLAMDLPRLLDPLGVEILLEESHIHHEVVRFARANKLSPLELAILGGEDYALLGSTSEEDFSALKSIIPELTIVGKVVEKKGICIEGRKVDMTGFDHFGA